MFSDLLNSIGLKLQFYNLTPATKTTAAAAAAPSMKRRLHLLLSLSVEADPPKTLTAVTDWTHGHLHIDLYWVGIFQLILHLGRSLAPQTSLSNCWTFPEGGT